MMLVLLSLFFITLHCQMATTLFTESVYTDSSSTLRHHFPVLAHLKDTKIASNPHSSAPSGASKTLVEDEAEDFEDPDLVDFHDGSKRQYDDYGHLRFGKRGGFDDYGHMRFGKRNFDDYGHMRFGKRDNAANNDGDEDYGHLRFGR